MFLLLQMQIYLAEGETRNDFQHNIRGKVEFQIFLGNILIYLLVFGILVNLFLSFFGQDLLSYIFPGVEFFPYIILAIWISYLSVFFNFKLNFFRIRNQSVQYGIFNFTKFLSLIILTIIAIVILKLGALGKFYAEFIISFF